MGIRSGFNRIGEFIGILDNRKYKCLDEIGQFCKGKMDELVAVDTGYLKSRNQYEVTKWFTQRLRLKNDAIYAGFIEYGTSKMIEQPFIRPAIYNYTSQIQAIVRRAYSGI